MDSLDVAGPASEILCCWAAVEPAWALLLSQPVVPQVNILRCNRFRLHHQKQLAPCFNRQSADSCFLFLVRKLNV